MGTMCVISWYDDPGTGCGLADVADVAVGAEDMDGLRTAMKRVRDLTEVTFQCSCISKRGSGRAMVGRL
ncbi:solid-state culture specific ATP-grasp domain-containing protein [Colletotrichum abscissum]|uniref:solid-state culture specific ATP-grasp domain-containing protein n=1 Tax=Colletotrichum abscissum TaxID=1671311 RepID=UPI0027D63630|nr:solid-state culture specific ATP-grasp domain-containing protein [Colletotrichum abscissum]KAK1514614.1 solid-state culture specific ATP-grasp domain-containing protein [Colletotrichum abscissum]